MEEAICLVPLAQKALDLACACEREIYEREFDVKLDICTYPVPVPELRLSCVGMKAICDGNFVRRHYTRNSCVIFY